MTSTTASNSLLLERPARPGKVCTGLPSIDRSVLRFFESQPDALFLALGLLLIAGTAALDYGTGPELSFAIFYLIPIAVGAWWRGFSYGILFSVLSTVAWHETNSLLSPQIPWGIQLWNGIVRFSFFVITSSLLSRLRTAMLREQTLARTDPLTGVVNGRTFYEEVQRELQRSVRTSRPLTAAYLDLDNFKQINDRMGHSAGDELLCQVAQVIQKNTRGVDIIARLGGDEFAVLLPETDAAAAAAWLTRLREALTRDITECGWPVTGSVGAATFLRPPPDVDVMIRRIDALMYQAKRDGKNACRHVIIENPETLPAAGEPAGERRATVRILCNQPARIILGESNGSNSFATIRNISLTGIGMHLESRLPESAVVTVEPLATTPVKTLLARVVHSRRDSRGWYHGCELSNRLSEAELAEWGSGVANCRINRR